jgi:predicted phage terminase large subunit-like protein
VKSKERPSAGKGTKRQSPVLRLGDEAIPPELRHLRNHPAFELAYRFPKEGLKHFERLRCEQSLLAFFERAWREIDPAPLKVNWHHAAICAHLEAVSRGEIRRLVINVPPRSTKTLIVNVCWPAWCWTQPKIGPLSGPQVKFMCISYGQRLSTEIATLARRLILSEWYQQHWGDRVKILDDQGRIDNFGTVAGGFRIATSMTGATLGRGGDARIVDDPQSVEDANSQIETENVTRTYRESLQTRETDPSTSAEVLIMQRLGQDDLSGYILQKARDDVVHVCYPMRHIPEAHCTTPWYDDPRTERDELLWPEQFPKEVVDNYEFELGPFSFAGQFMQQPVPRGGGIFKNEWFEAWPPLDEMGEPPIGAIVNGRIIYPALEYVVAWLDTAHTIKEENDFCAMLTFGVFRAEGKGRIERQADGQYIRVADDQGYPKVLLLNAWLKRLTIHGPPEELPTGVDLKTWNSPQYLLERQKNWGLVEWVHHTAKRYKVDHLGIETQAVGHQLEQELHRLHSDATWSVELVPARGDKVARAYAVQGIVSSRQVYLPTFPDGTYPSWVDPCLDQILMFPKGRHDDATDAFCAGLKHLRDIGIFERRGEYEIAEEQSRIWIPGQQRLELPYDL